MRKRLVLPTFNALICALLGGLVGLSGGAHIAIMGMFEDQNFFRAAWLDGTQSNTAADLPEPQNLGERFATYINWRLMAMAELRLGRPISPPIYIIAPKKHTGSET